jgi:hypothetical protein
VNFDEITAIVPEYAARVGVPIPETEHGRVPVWAQGGAALRTRSGRPVLCFDSRFETLEPVEQEATLASMLASAPHVRRFLSAAHGTGCAVTAGVAFIAFIEAPVWLKLGVAALLVLGLMLTLVLLYRRIYFNADRSVVEGFGWPVMDTVLDVERKKPSRARGLYRIIPTLAQRTSRLERLVRVAR